MHSSGKMVDVRRRSPCSGKGFVFGLGACGAGKPTCYRPCACWFGLANSNTRRLAMKLTGLPWLIALVALSLSLARALILRSTSGLLLVPDKGGGELLHYKRARDRENLVAEADELVRVATACRPVSGIRAVVLRMYEPREGLLITEYVEGRSLFNFLWNSTRWFQWRKLSAGAAANVGTRLGEWLREYHASTTNCLCRPADAVQAVANDALSKLATLKARSPRFLSASTSSAIEKYLSAIAINPHVLGSPKTTKIHGDLELVNTMVSQQGDLVVHDFADTREGLAAEDLARLWHAIWSMSQLSGTRRRILGPCLQALLTAYPASDAIVEEPCFVFLRCWNCICNILTFSFLAKVLGITGRSAAGRIAAVNRTWLQLRHW